MTLQNVTEAIDEKSLRYSEHAQRGMEEIEITSKQVEEGTKKAISFKPGNSERGESVIITFEFNGKRIRAVYGRRSTVDVVAVVSVDEYKDDYSQDPENRSFFIEPTAKEPSLNRPKAEGFPTPSISLEADGSIKITVSSTIRIPQQRLFSLLSKGTRE